MSTLSRLFLFGCLIAGLAWTIHGSDVRAATRSPSSASEHSLLYWRYLCGENNPQTETVKNGWREISCPGQNWKVKAKENEDVVREVNEKVTAQP